MRVIPQPGEAPAPGAGRPGASRALSSLLPAVTAIFVTCLLVATSSRSKLRRSGRFRCSGRSSCRPRSSSSWCPTSSGTCSRRCTGREGASGDLDRVRLQSAGGSRGVAAGCFRPRRSGAAGYDVPHAAQRAYDAVLGFTPRLLLASFVAYLAGEFLNSFVLARLKVATAGRRLWPHHIVDPGRPVGGRPVHHDRLQRHLFRRTGSRGWSSPSGSSNRATKPSRPRSPTWRSISSSAPSGRSVRPGD